MGVFCQLTMCVYMDQFCSHAIVCVHECCPLISYNTLSDLYMYDARGCVSTRGRVHIFQPGHKELGGVMSLVQAVPAPYSSRPVESAFARVL